MSARGLFGPSILSHSYFALLKEMLASRRSQVSHVIVGLSVHEVRLRMKRRGEATDADEREK